MPTRNVVLTDHQAELIDRMVKSGRYQNRSEALREGLRLLEDRQREETAMLSALRDAAQIGIDDIEAGRFAAFTDPNTLKQHLATVANEEPTDD